MGKYKTINSDMCIPVHQSKLACFIPAVDEVEIAQICSQQGYFQSCYEYIMMMIKCIFTFYIIRFN